MEQIIIVSPQTQVCGDKEDGECNVSFGYVKDLNWSAGTILISFKDGGHKFINNIYYVSKIEK